MNQALYPKKEMQLLLHGPAIKASRIKLVELRNKFQPENVLVFEKDEDADVILTNLHSLSLFGEERLVIIENPPEGFANYTLNAIPCTLIMWFDHEIDVNRWPGFEVLLFPESKEISVFPFLDYLAAKDKKAFLEIDKLKKGGFEIQYFITMVFYLLRNLLVTPKNAPGFVKDKLQRQRKNFSKEDLIKLYKNILELDFKIKSGLLEKDQAEFLLINHFLG